MRKKTELHGDTNSPLYKKWRTMRLRVLYPDTNGYENYGGRGIKICDRWDSYLNFKEDMGKTFEIGMTLDRKDPDGDYTPDNCKWSTRLEQQRSKRRHLVFNGEMLVDYAKRTNQKYDTVAQRFRKYGTPEKRIV